MNYAPDQASPLPPPIQQKRRQPFHAGEPAHRKGVWHRHIQLGHGGSWLNYLNYDGERRINFYSGKVEPLGISAIGSALNGDSRSELDANTLEALLEKCAKELRDEYAIRVRRLVGGVVMTAKRKDGRDWQVDAIQNSDYHRKFIGRLPRQFAEPRSR